ncbi:YraN family protein [Lutimonas zeaxanthinifaciens]|uniref:YraN family protein n=1 Tax=Lutimonas zeaxanthinifaciens TaxID=3060215 RepID=UPI00265D22A6|nr:YraN family protein [Lutimonas sp. YSD2104]WKK65853.1 YraN family protein [Lutimonas sp. YSD2104]
MAVHNELGLAGEKIAVDFLREKGYHIRQRNWRFQKVEIDIIAQKDDLIVIVEVKTRSNRHFGNPQEFVNGQKMKFLLKAAHNYVVSRKIDKEIRFDIIAVIKSPEEFSIEHIKDAFHLF